MASKEKAWPWGGGGGCWGEDGWEEFFVFDFLFFFGVGRGFPLLYVFFEELNLNKHLERF